MNAPARVEPETATDSDSPAGSGSALTLSLGISAAIQVVGIVTGMLLARALGPSGRGELAAVILWPTVLASIGSLGITDAATFYAARSKTSAGEILGAGIVITTFQSVLLVAGGLALIPFALAGSSGTVRLLAAVYLLYIPLNLFALLFMGTLNGLHRFGAFHFLRLLLVGLSATGLAGLAMTGRLTLATAVALYLGANLVVMMVAAGLALWSAPSRPRSSRTTAKNLLMFGLRGHTGTVAGTLNERLAQLSIAAFLAPAKLGLYVVAVSLGSIGNLVGSSIAWVVLPRVARHEPGPQRARIAGQLLRLTFALTALAVLPLVIFTPWLLATLFGPEFEDAATLARILLAASVALGLNRGLSAVLTGLGRPLDAGLGEVLALGVTLLGLPLLLALFGLEGAALVSLAAYSTCTVWMLRRASRALATDPLGLLTPAADDLRVISRSRNGNAR